jgi:hypothetical protein
MSHHWRCRPRLGGCGRASIPLAPRVTAHPPASVGRAEGVDIELDPVRASGVAPAAPLSAFSGRSSLRQWKNHAE